MAERAAVTGLGKLGAGIAMAMLALGLASPGPAAGQATPRFVELRVADQGASERMSEIAARLVDLFARHGASVVITHAYEGGHPDHDATAFAVHAAARRCPELRIIEMTSYHAGPGGRLSSGTFLPNGAAARTRRGTICSGAASPSTPSAPLPAVP